MQPWREQKREARRVVHDTFRFDALYYATPTASPIGVGVRLQTKFTQIGDDRSAGWAEMEAIKPRLIFLVEDLTAGQPARNAVVYLQPGEAYFIDNTLPPDDITVTAEVVRVNKTEYTKMGLPKDAAEGAALRESVAGSTS